MNNINHQVQYIYRLDYLTYVYLLVTAPLDLNLKQFVRHLTEVFNSEVLE